MTDKPTIADFEAAVHLVRNEHGANMCSIDGCGKLQTICELARIGLHALKAKEQGAKMVGQLAAAIRAAVEGE